MAQSKNKKNWELELRVVLNLNADEAVLRIYIKKTLGQNLQRDVWPAGKDYQQQGNLCKIHSLIK